METSENPVFRKTVIMNRAVSGSGKTTLSRCVTDALRSVGATVGVHSTDDFFMRDGRYVFEIDKLHAYHAQNLANFTADLERGTDVVICDNMNLLPWQTQPYTDAARKYHYRILFLDFLPRELEKHLAAQVVTPEKPDAHGLSRELLERFIRNFNDYDDLLDPNTVRDIRRHRVFVWNHVDNVPMDTGALAQYFDSDKVIVIRPEEYHGMKVRLPEMVLDAILENGDKPCRDGGKKHFLLTWYGITDIRAALGLEPTDGPVLGALRTGRYTDAIVLGYTNPHKPGDAFSGGLRKEWEALRSRPAEERLAYPREKGQVLVDAACNTEFAHGLFRQFLEAAGLPVRIRLLPQELSRLNDARAIDHAARKAVRLALAEEGEKDITCFLSPGTPVMAYTWAMVARTNPNLHLRVIASSEPSKPPEEIDLPKDVLAPSLEVARDAMPTGFDAVIHLLGTETNIPQYFSLVQFPAPRHWFVSSSESKKANALRKLLPEGATMEVKRVDPFVPAHARKAVEEIVRSLAPASRVGLNLTGGTKLMFAGALNACNEFPDVAPFYFDIKQHHVTFIRSGANIPFKGVGTIDGFFVASGYGICTPGYWQDNPAREARRTLTAKLWERRNILGKLYQNKEFRAYKVVPDQPNPPFDFSSPKCRATYRGGRATLVLDGETLKVPDCEDFGSYLGGGWLEEYVYQQLLPLQEIGRIHDLRLGLEIVSADHARKKGEMPFGEFDCAFTDGNRLFIVECKAGAVKQDHIQKLENNLKNYGGAAARGVLVFAFPPHPMLLARMRSSTSIRGVGPIDMAGGGLRRAIFS